MQMQGYHNTGINDILKAADIPKGSFYNFFDSKEHFGVLALDHYGNKALDAMRKFLAAPDRSPMQRLESFYDNMVVRGNEKMGCKGGCFVNNISNELGGLSEALGRKADQVFGKWIDEITYVIKQGQEMGEIRDDYPPEELAEYIHTSIFGGIGRMKATRSIEKLRMIVRLSLDFIQPVQV